MAQSYVTTAGTLIIPGAYSQYTVEANNSGLATTGVLMLVGEADAGPDFSLEDDLALNSFGPDQFGDVAAKYKSGRLVDAFRVAATPANDPGIPGAPSRIILVKTNVSTKASLQISNYDASDYGVLADKSYGKLGNLVNVTLSANSAEVVPTTGSFTFIPPVGTVSYSIRANGGAAVGGTLSAATTPLAFATAVALLTGVTAAGGTNRAAHPASGTLAASAPSGNTIVVTTSTAFGATCVAGDTLVIPDGSVIEGAANANVGAYVVTAVTSTQLFATKLSDASKPAAVAGTITAPAAVSAATVVGAADMVVYAPVSVSNAAADPIPGRGKSLEIAETTSGSDLLSRTAYQLATTTAVTWVSKTGASQLLTSATEYVVRVNANRQSDNATEALIAGGEVALKVGYLGTTCSVVVDDTAGTMVVTVAGGAGASFTVTLADFPTISDLATYINARAGFSAAVGSGILGQLPATALDDGTFAAASQFGAQTLRLKVDAYKFFKKISEESILLQLQDADGVIVAASSGLPAPQAIAYLDGGAKGSTTAAQFQAGIDALELVQGNFLIPLISRDASEDIVEAMTESGSTYAIDAVNAACKTHVLAMGQYKRRRNRQAIVSKRGTFAAAKASSSNAASKDVLQTFQDFKAVNAAGQLVQFQPWMSAVNAAAMQAAGFYKAIVHKGINTNGAIQAAGDFDDRSDSQLEDALLAGLLIMRRSETGGWYWVSDQSTYGKDANFVYNSLQAVYIANVISLTAAQRMENAFVGQSVADVSAGLAKAYWEAIMGDFIRLKMIAPSDDAPQGFKNLIIKIQGPVMTVSCNVKLAGAIYFIPIDFTISQVSQSA